MIRGKDKSKYHFPSCLDGMLRVQGSGFRVPASSVHDALMAFPVAALSGMFANIQHKLPQLLPGPSTSKPKFMEALARFRASGLGHKPSSIPSMLHNKWPLAIFALAGLPGLSEHVLDHLLGLVLLVIASACVGLCRLVSTCVGLCQLPSASVRLVSRLRTKLAWSGAQNLCNRGRLVCRKCSYHTPRAAKVSSKL